MADAARQTLRDLVAAYGRALLDDPRRTEALLRDLCGERRREIFVLVHALRERVPAELLAPARGVPAEITHARLAQRLCDDLGLAPDAARWGVETWAHALAAVPAAPAVGAGAAGVGADAGGAPVPAALEQGARGVGEGAAEAAGAADGVEAGATAGESLVVSPHGDGHFARIGAAIEAAPPGARIVVRPGVYAESLVIEKPLAIVADLTPWPPSLKGRGDASRGRAPHGGSGCAVAGPMFEPAGQVVVETVAANCLRMLAGRAVVRGLVLRGRVGLGPRNLFAVDVRAGELVLEDCDVTSDSLACVAISGRAADPVLRRCRIHDTPGSGIFVHEGGRGTVEDCVISGHALAGVEIGRAGNPVLRRCRIHDGKQAGIYVSLGGTGTVEECAVFANAGSGVEIGWQGNPALRRCRITQNGRHGIRIYAGGAGAVEDCDLSGNALGPWDIEDGPVRHTGQAGDC